LSASSSRPNGRPVIGLTTYLQQAQTGVWDVPASFLQGVYIEGVTRAGGIALLLPPQPVDDEIAERVIDGIDGLLVAGGRDVDPAAYGQQVHEATDKPGGNRDPWEFTLLATALDRSMPVLGICRGVQVLNVALGGTLHQHLPDILGHTRHRHGNGVFSSSDIETVAGSKLASLIGSGTKGQCYHHQAVDRVGERLVISATDPDGVIEAIELPDEDFVVAVQWHPEETLDDLRIFAGFVEAAAEYATGRVNL